MKRRVRPICLLLVLVAISAAAADTWVGRHVVPAAVTTDAGLTWGSFPLSPTKDSIYATVGNLSSFYRYDVGLDQWVPMQPLPNGLTGGPLCFEPITMYERIYCLTSNNQLCFFVDDGSNGGHGLWVQTQYPWAHGTGAKLCYGGTGMHNGRLSGYAYALHGYGSTIFARYYFPIDLTRSPTPAAGWEAMGSLLNPAGTGAALAYDPWDQYNVYALRGGGYSHFYRYAPLSVSWYTADHTPYAITTCGALAAKTVGGTNDSIYVLTQATDKFSYYSTSNDAWHTYPAELSWTLGEGVGLAYCPKDRFFYATRGGGNTDFAQYQPYGGGSEGGGQSGPCPSTTVPTVSCRQQSDGDLRIQCDFARNLRAVYRVFGASGREVGRTVSDAGYAVWKSNRGVPSGVYAVTVTGPHLYAVGHAVVSR
jgi:hypothetical protein